MNNSVIQSIVITSDLWNGPLTVYSRQCKWCKPCSIPFLRYLKDSKFHLRNTSTKFERNDNMKSSSPLLPTPDLVVVENLPPGSVRVIENKALDFRGAVVGHYSVAVDNELYDLNDHYSKPLFLGDKTIIRSPAEAAINSFALVCLIILSAYAYFQNPESLDYWTLPFKVIHFIFHTIVHIVPNWSSKDGMEHRKCLRIICGIVFGISRYIVLLIYLFRIGTWVFGCVLLVFLLTIKLKFLGELIKTCVAYVAISFAMCQGNCSGMCNVVLLGAALQLAGSGAFYYVGQVHGHFYKPWLRDKERKWIPYHVTSDLGNALFLIGAAYDPKSATPLAFNQPGSHPFPTCWWGP